MYAVSSAFLEALRSSHEVTIRARLYADATTTTPTTELSVVDGSVRVDTGSGVRRSLSAKFASADGSTATLLALLTNTGQEIGVDRGIRFPNGRVEWAPLGRFRIDTVEDDLAERGAVSVTAPDHAARIIDDRFLAPRSASVGLTIGLQIERLLQESIPGVPVNYPASTPTIRNGVVWEESRWDAVVDLAASIGCVVYADPTGAFQVVPPKTMNDAADWLVDSGRTGVLLGGGRSSTREGVYNSVRASSSPTDGSAPVSAVAEDTDATSATYVSGPYGRVPRFYASPLLTTTAQAQSAAQSILARSLGKRGSLSLESIVNPALEGGDRLDVFLPDGGYQRHLVDAFEIPLSPSGSMTIQTRSASEPVA